MSNTVEQVLTIAEAEIGYLEKQTNDQLDSKTSNAGTANYTKYARDLDAITGFYNGKKNGYPWCDVFVDWCFVKAYGTEQAKALLCQPDNSLGASTTASANYFKQKGRFYQSNPQKGDQIFFADSSGNLYHTGIICDVQSTTLSTIEGNTSGTSGVIANGGSVCKKTYAQNYSRIAGYGRPNYDAATTSDSDKATSTTGSTKAATTSTATAASTTTAAKSGSSSIIKSGQTYANKFAGTSIAVDGIRGTETKKAGIKVLQHAMNLDYGNTIAEDGIWGTQSNAKLGSHYVAKGETQYMATALEILLMLKGYDPHGVEIPGIFGSGLYQAVRNYQADYKLTVDGIAGVNTFRSLIV